MRYRIVIEIDTELERATVNELAKLLANDVQKLNNLNLVYLATELVPDKERNIQYEKD